MIVYRGDTRTPEKIIEHKGFSPKKAMGISEARRTIIDYCKGTKNPLDLSRLIISSPQKEYLSTDIDEDCGGYSSQGYIYKIEIDGLTEKEFKEEVLGEKVTVKQSNLYPRLLLNAPTLSTATIIGLKNYGNATREITFLTSIPLDRIKAYKAKGSTVFVDMLAAKTVTASAQLAATIN